jgi:MoaA/NifB/PqqE/SkfB family radical SAM enzyme
MSAAGEKGGVRILSGWRAALHKLRFRASMLKYLARPKKFPLFVLDEARGGLRRTQALGRALGLGKVPQLGRHAYRSLTFPRWPSPAFDRMVAGGGLNIAAGGTPLKRQVDMAFLSVTRQCAYACGHCYERASLGGEEIVPVSRWIEIVADLQEQGVNVVVLTGGEPMLRLDRVLAILESGRKELPDFHLHTSGHGVTPGKARRLAEAGLVAAGVGLDDHDRERHDRLRGHDGAFEEATHALRCFRDAGVFTYLNTCLTSALVRGDGLARHLALARELGVGTVRYLEPKPCGVLFDGGAERLFTEDDRARVASFVARANLGREHRGDPPVQYAALAEAPERLGCLMGGLSHFSIDGTGNVLPCVFLPVTFGNVLREGFPTIFARMRTRVPSPVRSGCPTVTLHERFARVAAEGAGLPVPVEALAGEWDALFAPAGATVAPRSGAEPGVTL